MPPTEIYPYNEANTFNSVLELVARIVSSQSTPCGLGLNIFILFRLNGRTRFRAGNNVVTFNSTGPATNTVLDPFANLNHENTCLRSKYQDVVIRMQQMSDTVYSEDPTRSRKVGKPLTLHCSDPDFSVLKGDF
jgi:hypothetical protein